MDLRSLCACCTAVELIRKPLPGTLGAIEYALAETLIEAWESRTGAALARTRETLERRGVSNMEDVHSVLEDLRVELGPELSAETFGALQVAMEAAYVFGRQDVFGGRPGDVLLTAPDARAQAWLTEHHNFWIGDAYETRVSAGIADIVRDKVIGQGMDPLTAGRAMAEVMGAEFSRTENYWRLVAQNASNNSVNFGRVGSFEQAGVKSFRVVNPKDTDTSEVCNYMHGVVYVTAAATQQRDGMMAAKTPEAVKLVHKWTTVKELRRVGGSVGGASADSAALARAGIVLPGYHGFCRTLVVAHSIPAG